MVLNDSQPVGGWALILQIINGFLEGVLLENHQFQPSSAPKTPKIFLE